jgi:hypothetical protein
VSKVRTFVEDDDDDTGLFALAEEYVLSHYPNPDRIGCLHNATLQTFVAEPGKIDLSDLKFLHIVKCAECTRDLIELRRLRENTLQRNNVRSTWSKLPKWRHAASVTGICVLTIFLTRGWTRHLYRWIQKRKAGSKTYEAINLNIHGTSLEETGSNQEIVLTLPRKLIDLHLVLPRYSPPGDYRISVIQEDKFQALLIQNAIGVEKGAKTELQVSLNLRQLTPGRYYLVTAHDDASKPYFFPLIVD